MIIAYLGLGSNIGDRKQFLHRALQLLVKESNIWITKVSSLYETEPWGYKEQELFMNLVVEIETQLTAIELLQVCQKIEQSLERVREIKWGPRTMDVDILLYGDETIASPQLKIPHPYLIERDFVVIPLAEIAPQLIINSKTMAQWSQSYDQSALRKISK